ncbi:uncharacterized protein LOC114659139 [Erpetoichthys calabaricus]|uniref:uncharacterized protein LOC114659139 n=1 Tax=Erpetoichthys calabaricus TaxID=27687 RepID=UPI00109EE4EF|nr:uncharacterized protein LOC114659139 [Erpetoichthys calabaricus]XP_039592093.1 uncharacterized protein LOC120515292 [Polypterus senegalus]
MDNSYENLIACNNNTDNNIADLQDCYICGQGEGRSRDALQSFCDCKTLVTHEKCILTWILKGAGSEDRSRCGICKAEYILQKKSTCLQIACQWRTWLVCSLMFLCMVLNPFVVYKMMTAYRNPPPHTLFKVAAICFGILAEILLIKYLVNYCRAMYSTAKMSSFSVRARSVEKCDTGTGLLWPAAAAQNSSTAAVSREGESKQEAVKASEGPSLKLRVCV